MAWCRKSVEVASRYGSLHHRAYVMLLSKLLDY
jgi:hypothetical protein